MTNNFLTKEEFEKIKIGLMVRDYPESGDINLEPWFLLGMSFGKVEKKSLMN